MILPYTKWLALGLGTRVKLAQVFGIAKLRSTHVSDNHVMDDGYNIKDVENAMSVPSLQTYLNSAETDIIVLFQMAIDKVEGKTTPIIDEAIVTSAEVELEEEEEPVVVKAKKKPVKKKK